MSLRLLLPISLLLLSGADAHAQTYVQPVGVRAAEVRLRSGPIAPVAPAEALAVAGLPGRQAREEAPLGLVVLGSTLCWALGTAAGAAVGYAVQPDAGDNWFGAGEWWLGAWLGSSLGAATGAYVANGSRGRVVLASLGSLVAAPLGIMIAAVGTSPLAIPAAQIGVSVLLVRLD